MEELKFTPKEKRKAITLIEGDEFTFLKLKKKDSECITVNKCFYKRYRVERISENNKNSFYYDMRENEFKLFLRNADRFKKPVILKDVEPGIDMCIYKFKK